MAVEITVADRVEIEAIRGVAYSEEFSLFENDGTEAAPVRGAPMDLTDWPLILLMADVIVDQAIVRGTASYLTRSPARFSIEIPVAELNVAFDAANNSRPLHVTVKAGRSGNTQERTLLSGVLRVRESGY